MLANEFSPAYSPGRIVMPFRLKTHSTGADVPETERKLSSSGYSIWIAVSAFSCNHGCITGYW